MTSVSFTGLNQVCGWLLLSLVTSSYVKLCKKWWYCEHILTGTSVINTSHRAVSFRTLWSGHNHSVKWGVTVLVFIPVDNFGRQSWPQSRGIKIIATATSLCWWNQEPFNQISNLCLVWLSQQKTNTGVNYKLFNDISYLNCLQNVGPHPSSFFLSSCISRQ